MWCCLIDIPREQTQATLELVQKNGFEATTNYLDGIWVVVNGPREEMVLRLLAPGRVVAYKDFASVMKESH